MARGGTRTGAGRPRGKPNRRTEETQRAVELSGITPLDYMLALMRDEGTPPVMRFEAAKAAAPYVHAKLASVEHSGPDGGPFQVVIAGRDADL